LLSETFQPKTRDNEGPVNQDQNTPQVATDLYMYLCMHVCRCVRVCVCVCEYASDCQMHTDMHTHRIKNGEGMY